MKSESYLTVKQPRGEIRVCERDGATLHVVLLVGADDWMQTERWEVYMQCPVCEGQYMEVAKFTTGVVAGSCRDGSGRTSGT